MGFFSKGCDRSEPTPTNLNQQIDQMYTEYKQKSFPDIPDIAPDKIKDKLAAQSPLILDVREPAEQQISIIPGAITKQQFENNPALYQNRPIIVYCTVGYRSGLYTQQLLDQQFNAFNLKGGVLAWAANNGQFQTPEGKTTKKVHVYGKKWNILPAEYKPVW